MWDQLSSDEQRMQLWVDTIKAEHLADPIDYVFILGDVSLDHWISGGSYLDGVSTTRMFVNNYVSQIRAMGIPVMILPGNHEQYSDEQWLALTGNHREEAISIGDYNMFICLDTYSGNLNPTTDHDGVYTGIDSTDIANISSYLQGNPQKNAWILGHYFSNSDLRNNTAFKSLVQSTDKVRGLFAGHTHQCRVYNIDREFAGGTGYGSLQLVETGNFSYTAEFVTAGNFTFDSITQGFWGIRDLKITGTGAVSSYIIPATTVKIGAWYGLTDNTITIPRQVNHVAYYSFN